jgi:PAS domain S-box-containing protein
MRSSPEDAGPDVPPVKPARRQAQETLRHVELQFDRLVAGVQDYAIFLLDPDGRVASWNTGAQRLKGYAADEIIGEHFSRFYPQDALDRRWPEHELEWAARSGRFEDENWRLRKDGTPFWANVVITAVRDETGELRGFLKITRDLTERRMAEQALRESEENLRRLHGELEERVKSRTALLAATNAALRDEIDRRRQLEGERGALELELRERLAELAAADRHKNEFLAMLGHELRNPLAPIRNSLEVLRAVDDEGPRLRALEVAQRQVQHLHRLVDDLLDVSRIMEGKIDVRRERVELAAVIARAVETAEPLAGALGHHIVQDLPGVPIWVDGDLVRLAQVLSNLLSNAAKYTEEAGPIFLEAAVEGDQAVIRVRDRGIGIDPALLPHIFEFFVQGERALARSQGGLGIGLTLARRLIDMHGGTLTAHSEGPGRGTEMTVRLPLASPEPSAETASETVHEPAGGRRVLVVDDNVDAADSTVALLELWGHEAVAVYDGPAALEAARDHSPQVVLLDIGLPGMTGYEVAQRLRELPGSAIELLAAMTGYGQDEDRRRAAEAGFDLHLTKPLDPSRLRELVETLGR